MLRFFKRNSAATAGLSDYTRRVKSSIWSTKMKFFLLCCFLLASCLLAAEGASIQPVICPAIYCFVNPCQVLQCEEGYVCVSKCPCDGVCEPILA